MDELDKPIIKTEQGKVLGSISKNIEGNLFYSFKGIPYARPPFGELRFQAPLPPLPYEGIFNATKNGNCCSSKDLLSNKIIGSEDCLNLNVYTPNLPNSHTKTLPVMVFVHGGGFICGSNDSNIYGPEYLMTKNVILVTINYRLGLLGFLSVDDSSAGIPGNAGFKDMVMALKWVQRNIHNFNGNPNNVTIFGESAGGVAVHFLTLSPMAKGLFHKAIVQSGCALNPWSRARKVNSSDYKLLGFKGHSGKELLQHLQNISVEELLQAQNRFEYVLDPDKLQVFGLVLERPGHSQCEEPFLCEDPIDIMISGNFHSVPLIIGFTKLEGVVVSTYSPKRIHNMVTDFQSNVIHFLGYQDGSSAKKVIGEKIREYYFGSERPNKNNRNTFYELVSDNLFIYGIIASVRKQLVHSQHPIFLYRFSLKTSLTFFQALMTEDSDKALAGAHGDDIPYLFKTSLSPSLHVSSEEYQYVKKMLTLWTNFAHFGHPTLDSVAVKWKNVTADSIGFLEIDKDLKFYKHFDHKSITFWDKLYAESPQGQKFSNLMLKI